MIKGFDVPACKTMHELGTKVSNWRWKVQEGGVPVPNAKIMWIYDQWMQTVAKSADYIVYMTGKGHAIGTMPTRNDFVQAVLNGPGSKEMKRLETW